MNVKLLIYCTLYCFSFFAFADQACDDKVNEIQVIFDSLPVDVSQTNIEEAGVYFNKLMVECNQGATLEDVISILENINPLLNLD